MKANGHLDEQNITEPYVTKELREFGEENSARLKRISNEYMPKKPGHMISEYDLEIRKDDPDYER